MEPIIADNKWDIDMDADIMRGDLLNVWEIGG